MKIIKKTNAVASCGTKQDGATLFGVLLLLLFGIQTYIFFMDPLYAIQSDGAHIIITKNLNYLGSVFFLFLACVSFGFKSIQWSHIL